MTSTKTSLARASPLPCIRQKRPTASLKPSLANVQPILPDIVSSSMVPKPQNKKRVRFALKLDPVEEHALENSSPDQSLPNSPKPKIEPWRENGPLFGAYVEYLEEKDSFKPDLPPDNNRPTTPVPDFDTSATFTHIYHIQNRHSELVVNSPNLSTSSNHLPRLAQQIKTSKRFVKKPPSPVMDYKIKRRMNTPMPPHSVQGKRIVHPTVSPVALHSAQTVLKRNDFALPIIKSPRPTEKVIRTDQPLGSKLVNEYLHTKKMTEIINNSLPGTNTQINYICGHSVLPTLRKASPTSCRTPVNHESFFYQNRHHDHIQPIIHSTH